MEFEWDEYNRREIAAHGVAEAEAEAAYRGSVPIGIRYGNGEERLVSIGFTSGFRILIVSAVDKSTGLVRVITA